MSGNAELESRFEWFADWAEGTSPLYARLAREVASDPPIADLAATVPEGQPPPHLLFAAVHFLLLDGADHPLRGFYPTCADDPADPEAVDPYPAFREFCLEREASIREFAATHNTQTNSVRRCAALLPAFSLVSRRAGDRPLAFVEVGTSAGLNLCWDRYRYDYGAFGAYGPAGSTVRIESAVRGDLALPFPDALPEVASRTGLDLNPLDLRDPTDLHTLRAFIWPEHAERHDLIRRAAEEQRRDPPELVAGDATETLPRVLDSIPTETPVCLFDTQVRYQMDDDTVARLDAIAEEAAGSGDPGTVAAGDGRDIYWLTGDETADDREHGLYLDLATYGSGGSSRERLAVYEQHGEWVEWLDPGSSV